jgi:hypothetical protein
MRMARLNESRSNGFLKIFDKTLENSAWAGIVASCVVKNMIPYSIKERLKNSSHRFDDRRVDRRLHVDRTVKCIRDKSEMDSVHLINISSGGMYVETDRPADIGQELPFDLSGRNMGSFMKVMGKVMRKTDRGMAVKFI